MEGMPRRDARRPPGGFVRDYVLNAFITLFIVIDPIGVAPVFVGLTARSDTAHRERMAWRGVVLAACILYAFALGGSPLLAALGVSLPAFRIAGGVLLFLLAVDMILVRSTGLRFATGEEQREAMDFEDISVFPLAIPLIAGPGALTSLVLLMGRAEGNPVRIAWLLGALAVVLAFSLVALLFAARLTALLGTTGTNVVARVLGIVLAALAVQYVLDGLIASGVLR
jgi:MarC family membrane protein